MRDNAWPALALAAVMVACGFAGRAGYLLFGGAADPPPDDPQQLIHWGRKRRWLVLSELSALPCFVALTVLVPQWMGWTAEMRGLFGLALGGFGWPFVSGVARALIERRLGVTNVQ